MLSKERIEAIKKPNVDACIARPSASHEDIQITRKDAIELCNMALQLAEAKRLLIDANNLFVFIDAKGDKPLTAGDQNNIVNICNGIEAFLKRSEHDD
ncbi:MAG: hypothetical protein MJA83_10185 [Gammaproteobacteria bacterium]|nr:hypothetical protein [Gammaproteobacteria bacterium]